MANIFELNINLNSTEKTKDEKALENTTNGSLNNSDDDNKKDKASSTIPQTAKFAVRQTVQIAKQAATFELNKAGTVYGDQARQNAVDNVMTTAGAGMNIASMTATGASIGGGWGALIGLVLGVTGEAIQMVQRNFEYNVQQQEHMTNSNYAKERLGILTASKGR